MLPLKVKNSKTETDKMEQQQPTPPIWCQEQQIYIGGQVPSTSDFQLQSLLSSSSSSLRIFGYGSLCWNPGTKNKDVLAHDRVRRTLGRAVGWKRCWAQRSADHRGVPAFPGLVCTLLTDDEVQILRSCNYYVNGEVTVERQQPPSMTEGIVYTVPPDLVEECLKELDFREKGGYSRDLVDVVEDGSEKTVKALLYRGNPDNPAFWTRALFDLPFAAAIMAVSIGPSGSNDAYLYNLDKFLSDAAASSPAAAAALEDHSGDFITRELATMARTFQKHCHLNFLFGSGSNQHNNLLLHSPNNAACLVNGEDAHELKDIVLVTPKFCSSKEPSQHTPPPKPKRLYAGGGHSALLTEGGDFFLWGWNEQRQLGREDPSSESELPVAPVYPLKDLKVQDAALGHTHTLVIEKNTGKLYGFGENGRQQVDESISGHVAKPAASKFLVNDRFVQVAAGLFHSAAITTEGELITFGCGRYGQCIRNRYSNDESTTAGRWLPDDGSRLVKVACGRRHTVLLDEYGRVWTLGLDNKYGQLGRSAETEPSPHLVDGVLGTKGSGCVDVDCGWSHNMALILDPLATGYSNAKKAIRVYGWGRNDRGQLGFPSDTDSFVSTPTLLHDSVGCSENAIKSIQCGAESSMIIDEKGDIWGCGWNEHGNLSTGSTDDAREFTKVVGARITAPPHYEGSGETIMAVGGAHFLAMKI